MGQWDQSRTGNLKGRSVVLYEMKNPIQKYHWGDYNYLPELLSMDNNENVPFAEYWMGSHHSAPSQLNLGKSWENLDDLIKEDRENILGSKVWNEYQEMPFLLKILSIRLPLSLQVHPSKTDAIAGFNLENKRGIQILSPQRNYKDTNHKPEVLYALGDFWALKDFKPLDEIQDSFIWAPDFMKKQLRVFSNLQRKDQVKEFFHWLLELNSDLQEELLQKIEDIPKHFPEWPWIELLQEQYPGDITVLAPLFMNLIHLKKGEAIVQRAGEIHAYLKGNGIEIMSNSDNVLRAGLTSKHIDIEELLKICCFQPTPPEKLSIDAGWVKSSEKDFCLYCYEGKGTINITATIGPRIILNLGNEITIVQGNQRLSLPQGQSLFSTGDCQGLTIEGKDIYCFSAQTGKI